MSADLSTTPFAWAPWLRVGVFVGVLAAMMLWERARPRRPRRHTRRLRWTSNLGVVAIDSLVLRLLLPGAAIGAAWLAETNDWGLFHRWPVPYAAAFALSVLALDFAIYLQHVLFHAVPVLWRLHRMHHADLDFDTTTGVRFHPLEIVLSMVYKMAVVAVLGAPVLAVLAFEVLLNASSLFNHGNVRLPARADRALRWLVVTPDMHRVHHSVVPFETNSNYGFNLSWWDRLLGTYRAQPQAGHERMVIGLEAFRDQSDLRLDRMLWQPLRAERRRRKRPL